MHTIYSNSFSCQLRSKLLTSLQGAPSPTEGWATLLAAIFRLLQNLTVFGGLAKAASAKHGDQVDHSDIWQSTGTMAGSGASVAGDIAFWQVFKQSSRVTKLFRLPRHPPYEKVWHSPVALSKAYRTKLPRHGPCSAASWQMACASSPVKKQSGRSVHSLCSFMVLRRSHSAFFEGSPVNSLVRIRTPAPQVELQGLQSLQGVVGHMASGASISVTRQSGAMHFCFSTTVMWGHFLRPMLSTKDLVRMEIPIPQVAEHSDHGAHLVVLQTPTPSPPSSTVALSRLISSESASSLEPPLGIRN